jgi:hypothetical protein
MNSFLASNEDLRENLGAASQPRCLARACRLGEQNADTRESLAGAHRIAFVDREILNLNGTCGDETSQLQPAHPSQSVTR